jgi:hypothetical protein
MFARCLATVIRYRMTTVEREAGGRFKKGVVANPFGGMPRAKVMALKKLEGLTGKAIARLERLIEDPNGAVAISAVREVLDRNLGKPKQNVTVDVTSTHVLHLQALEELAERKRRQIIEAQAIDITPLSVSASVSDNPDITLDRIVSHDPSDEIGASVTILDMSATVEAPRPPEAPGAAAYAPPTLPTPQNPPTDDLEK